MKNKGLLLGLYILAALLIAGCGNQSQGTEEKQDGQTAAETPKEESPEEPGGEQTVDGVVRSFTGSYLSIRDENGDIQSFDLGDAELDCKNGILAGGEVTLTYVNEEDELTNEEVARLRRVSDREGAKPPVEETMRGTVLDASADTLTVQGSGDNGRDIVTFFTVGTEFRCESGIGPDDEVTVTYRGDLQGSNARNVKVLSVTGEEPEETAAPEESGKPVADVEKPAQETDEEEPAEETPDGEASADSAEDSPAPEETPTETDETGGEPKEAKGSILRVDGTLLVAELSGEPDEEYEFDLSDTKIELKYGLLEGSEVLLTYRESAKEDEDAIVEKTPEPTPLLSLCDVDPDVVNESTGGFSITGTVMAAGTSTMTVTSDDGAQITCTTEDAEFADDDAGFLREGAYVVVVIEPNSSSNVYRALSIEPAY